MSAVTYASTIIASAYVFGGSISVVKRMYVDADISIQVVLGCVKNEIL